MTRAQQQRQALCDTAQELGPNAATLCSPWLVSDLLAHLVVREHRPDALPGIGAGSGRLGKHTQKLQDQYAQLAFDELVELVRQGPPRWSPISLKPIDNAVNTAEFLIHHEDLLRAQPDWAPRDDNFETEQAAWATLRMVGKGLYRKSPVGVVLVAPGHGRMSAHRPKSGQDSVVLKGNPIELLLHAFGRTTVATIKATGKAGDIEALSNAERGA